MAARPTEDSKSLLQRLSAANEEAWLSLGRIADMMGDDQNTMIAYEKVLSHNRMNATALSAIGCVYEKMEDYTKAADCFRGLVSLNEQNSDAWGHLGYCCLMMNDLTSAHTAYQYAMYNNPTSQKDPNMWYGIGQLYERLGSLEHAQESFEAVLRFEPNFNMALEVKFRLGIIAKQRGDYDGALESLKSVLHDVQTNVQTTDMASDIWTQIGHVYELKEEIQLAKSSYLKVAELNPNNAKPLQQLGWLCLKHSEHAPAIDYLKKAVALDPQDGKGWYLLGRCYMAVHEFEEAYDSYKHAVTTDPQNPNVWCSLGVLFYQLNQHLDALDAYSRAININPNICEVWYNIGTLYDTCNQTSDARDAYQKAAELGADAQFIRERLDLLRARETGQPTMGMAGANSAPGPSEPPTTSPMPTFTSRPTPETSAAASRAASPAQREGGAAGTDATARLAPSRSSVHQMLRGEHSVGDSRGAGSGVAALQSVINATSGAMGATRGSSVASNVPVRVGPDGRGMLPRGMVGGANMPPQQQQQQQHFHHQPPQLSLPAQQQQQQLQQRHAPSPMASHLHHRSQQLSQSQGRHPGQMHLQHPAQVGHAHPMQQQQQGDRREMPGRMVHDERASGVRYAMESGRGAMGPPPPQRLGSFGSKPMGPPPPGAHNGGSLPPPPQQQQQQHQQPRGVERFPMPMGSGDAMQMRHPASMAMPPVRR